MSDGDQLKFSTSNPNKLDLILLTLQRLQEDLQITKSQIQTSIREVGLQQNYISDALMKLDRNFRDINERLHSLELRQERQNSSA
jgi:hypothetical protein